MTLWGTSQIGFGPFTRQIIEYRQLLKCRHKNLT
jgi:hypothetical protein